jgi:hypothetical protein
MLKFLTYKFKIENVVSKSIHVCLHSKNESKVTNFKSGFGM